IKGPQENEVVTDYQRASRGSLTRRELPAPAHADGARPRRRAATDVLPGCAGSRRAPVRRDQRHETYAAALDSDRRWRPRVPHLRAGPRRLVNLGSGLPCEKLAAPTLISVMRESETHQPK